MLRRIVLIDLLLIILGSILLMVRHAYWLYGYHEQGFSIIPEIGPFILNLIALLPIYPIYKLWLRTYQFGIVSVTTITIYVITIFLILGLCIGVNSTLYIGLSYILLLFPYALLLTATTIYLYRKHLILLSQ